jgi:DNA-binding transcriptional LysR family regulator
MFPRIVGLSLYDDVVAACRDAGFEMIVAQEAPQMPSVVNLVAADLGVSIVPTAIAQIRLAGVAYRPIEGKPLSARLALASMKSNHSPLIENLMSLLPNL